MIVDWQASIADADLADWITVAAYLIAAVLTYRAASSARPRSEHRERLFWLASTALLVFLAVNELLDLQTLITTIGKEHARANGWYEERRTYQAIFIAALAAAAIAFGLAVLWLIRRMHSGVKIAVLGFVFIGAFVLGRAASFHHFDEMLGRGPDSFNYGSVQEVFGVAIVGLAAVVYRARKKRRRRR
ncbi:hypothetical protein [Qipengyuania atrilutea]|uniref:Uncharacterized protein n=1 Tax=Qipengyuania atrilutea TaxID=2744473 RepID=A0A850H8L9_9SPHN|nr:hypothetical protein [Actirhodobacter atriluteus]NVD43439.1 hypothetical protein [Actirhodobacter atriluteus]